MSILHVVGARPNIPKLAPVVHALDALQQEQVLLHTGQHYDDAMSGSLFRELDLRSPDVNLGVGSGSHAVQTGQILARVETIVLSVRPKVVVVYGDVNSALGAALVASKLNVPVAHVEAGLRSGDRSMPEEVNRVVVDALSQLLFATSPDAVENLLAEGHDPASVCFVGNPMIDSLRRATGKLESVDVASAFGLPDRYAIATVHRPSNVDNRNDAARVVEALRRLASHVPTVLPLHPRGREALTEVGLLEVPGLRVIGPQSYLTFLALLRGASVVMTDSGGVQEETTAFGVPCLTLRPNTERPVTIWRGTNRLITHGSVDEEVTRALVGGVSRDGPLPELWDGQAGPRIAQALRRFINNHDAHAL